MNRSARSLLAAAAITAGTLGFASQAHAGTVTYYRECGPDGNTIVYLTATNGISTVYIDGVQTHMLVTGPGEHVIEWYGPATNGDGTTDPTRIVLWDRKVITVAPSNCQVPTTVATTTTQAQATTSEPASTTTTVAPASSTIPPAIDMDVDPCVTSATGCPPPAQVTGDQRLPETGQDTTPLVVTAGALLALGTTLVLVRRRPA